MISIISFYPREKFYLLYLEGNLEIRNHLDQLGHVVYRESRDVKLLFSSNLETFSIGRPESLESLFWVRSGQVMKTSGDALLTVSRFLRLPTNPSCTNIQIQ